MNAPPAFPCDATSFIIKGPAGDLELLSACPARDSEKQASAVICHPHSLHGGSMQNKVVHTLARTYGELGLRTVRFNFRGVGASHGSFDHGIGETADLYAVIDWLRRHRPQDQLWLAGFSFGAYVAARAAAQAKPAHLVSVAPPVGMYDFTALTQPLCPWLIMQGDQDEVVDAKAVQRWAEQLSPMPDLVMFPDAGHFFHQRLNDLRVALLAHASAHIPPQENA